SRKYQTETGVPFIQGLPQTVRALQGLVHYATALRRHLPAAPEPKGRADNLAGQAFDALLASHGLIVPRSATATTADQAAAAAGEIVFRVAVKIVAPQASHKTEVGGVTLGLRDAAEVGVAVDSMTARLVRLDPGARIDGFLVQEMVSGVEMILG